MSNSVLISACTMLALAPDCDGLMIACYSPFLYIAHGQSMPHYRLVEQPDLLAPELADQQRLGVDTEFMREKTYFAQLCLVQIATSNDIYCVDPLTDSGTDEFWRQLLATKWVVHSARQDIEVISQTAAAMPSSIFDTQVAAGLLGYPAQMGYAGLVKELFDVDMDKSHTRADWSRRPLRDVFLDYAAEDVEHLLPAFELLSERLENKADSRGRTKTRSYYSTRSCTTLAPRRRWIVSRAPATFAARNGQRRRDSRHGESARRLRATGRASGSCATACCSILLTSCQGQCSSLPTSKGCQPRC